MKAISILILFCLSTFYSIIAEAKVLECIPTAEMSEQINLANHLYERDEVPKLSNTSYVDFEKLTVKGVHGRISHLVKIKNNLYGIKESPNTYIQTDDQKTVMTESNVRDSAAFVKILFCK